MRMPVRRSARATWISSSPGGCTQRTANRLREPSGFPGWSHGRQPTGQPAYHFDEWKNRYRRIEQHGTAFEGTD